MNKLIIKGNSNNLYLTVGERQTLVNPYYLFSFYSHSSKETTNCILPLLSSTTRYDLFQLNESANENLTGGTVSLEKGWYSYFVYEQASSTNLNLSSTGSLLEKGVVQVSGSTNEIIYSSSTTSLNYTFYNNS